MSFLSSIGSFFGKVGQDIKTGLTIEQAAAPIVSLIPGGGIVNTVVTGILGVEQLFPQSGLGAQKSALVQAAASSAAPGIDLAATQAAITQIVQGFNVLAQEAQAAFTKAKAPATPATPTPAAG